MILSLIATFYCSLLIYRAAMSSGRRGWLWGLATITWISLLQLQFGMSLIVIFIGLLSLFFPLLCTKPQCSNNLTKHSRSNKSLQQPPFTF